VTPRRSSYECVVNISEGRDSRVVETVAHAGGTSLLDVHSDPDHHRSVLTLGGPLEAVEAATRAVAAAAVARIALPAHSGVHPRMGSLDVVPFVALGGSERPDATSTAAALAARDRFARWAGHELGLPCFLYGPERSLPEVRRGAFTTLQPDTGPAEPHPTAGSTAVGARPVLVAYNVWIAGPAGGEPGQAGETALTVARQVAGRMRGPGIRALGLAVGSGAQVSLNLVDPLSVSLAGVFDAVAGAVESLGCSVSRGELVGLCPAGTLAGVPHHRWAELDLGEDRTIEARLAGRYAG
jgi:glutamate formiminotransferase